MGTYGRLPLAFEPNHGQVAGQVRFLSRGHGYTVFLMSNEAVINLQKQENAATTVSNSHGFAALTTYSDSSGTSQAVHEEPPSVVRMKLIGSRLNPQISGTDELPGKTNYFHGSDSRQWLTNVSTFAKVRYAQVYPGVDLVYYGNHRQLEHDFVLAPGANPGQIALQISGAGKLSLDAGGDLVLATRQGDLRLQKPVIYQEVDGARRLVAGGYAITGRRRIGFHVGRYDTSKPLVIDPVLTYSTYLGGSDTESGFGIAVDAAGNTYLTGETGSIDFPTQNALQPNSGGDADAFVTKINAAGQLIYSTYLGGSRADWGEGIAVDSLGNVYVTGFTYSSDFPTRNPFQATFGGGLDDAFVTKIDAAGVLVYSTYLGGSVNEAGFGIAVDRTGSAYVTGFTTSTNFPRRYALQPRSGNGADAFVTKLDATGTGLVYSTYLGGADNDTGRSIAVDSLGNAYVTGYTSSTDFPTFSAMQYVNRGHEDAFVTEIRATGTAFVYSTYLGGGDYDEGWGIAVDEVGNMYVTGYTNSADFPTTRNAAQPNYGGNHQSDAFVTKFKTRGRGLLYSTYLGGISRDEGHGIAVDAGHNAYVTGMTYSEDFPIRHAFQETLGSTNGDAFVTKINNIGDEFVYSTYLGGDGEDDGWAIAVDAAGVNAYVTGLTASDNFPIRNAFQATYRQRGDAFVSRISDCAIDVSSQVAVVRSGFRFNYSTRNFFQEVSIINISSRAVEGPLSLVLDSVSTNARLVNSSGTTTCAAPSESPLIAIPIGSNNLLVPGETVRLTLQFSDPSYQPITYTTRVLMGSNP